MSAHVAHSPCGGLDDSDRSFSEYPCALGLDLLNGDNRGPLDAPIRDSCDPDSRFHPDREGQESDNECSGQEPEEATPDSHQPPSPRPSLLVRSTRKRNLNRLSQEITSSILTASPVGSPSSSSPQLLPRAHSPRPASIRSHRSIKSHHSLSHPHYSTHFASRPHTRSASRASCASSRASRPRSLAEEIADVGEHVPEPELSSDEHDVSWAAILGTGQDRRSSHSSGASFDQQRTALPPPRSHTSSIASHHSVDERRTPSFDTHSVFSSQQSSAHSTPPRTPDLARPKVVAPRLSFYQHLTTSPSQSPTSADFSPPDRISPKRSTISSLASLRSFRGFRSSRKTHGKDAPGLFNILVPSQSHLHLSVSDFPSPVPELPNERDDESATPHSPLSPRRVPVPPITPTRSSRRILPKMPKVFKKAVPKVITTIKTTEEHFPNGDIVERTTATTRRRSVASHASYSSQRSQRSHLSHSSTPSSSATSSNQTHFVENHPVQYVANVPSAAPPSVAPAVNVTPPRVRKEIKPIMIVDYANPPATPGFTPSRATAPGPPVRSSPAAAAPAVAVSSEPVAAVAPAPVAKIPRTDGIDLQTALALNPEPPVTAPEPSSAPAVATFSVPAPVASSAEAPTAQATVVNVDATKGTVEVKSAPVEVKSVPVAESAPKAASTPATPESAPKAASTSASQAAPKTPSVTITTGSPPTEVPKAAEPKPVEADAKSAEKPAPQATTINNDPVKGNVEVIPAAPAAATTSAKSAAASSKTTTPVSPKPGKAASPKPNEAELPPRAKSPTPSLRSVDARVKRTSAGSEVIVSFSSQRGDTATGEKKVAKSSEPKPKAKETAAEKPRRPDHVKHHSDDSPRHRTHGSGRSHASSVHSKHHSVEGSRISRSHSYDHAGRSASKSGRSSLRAESLASQAPSTATRKRRILNPMSHYSSDGEGSDGEVEIAFAETEASLDVKIKARVPAMIPRDDDSDESEPSIIREDLATLSRADLRARIAAAERLMKEHPRLPSEIDDSHMPHAPHFPPRMPPKQWTPYIPAPVDPRMRYPAPGLMPGLGFAGLNRPMGVPMMLPRPQPPAWRRN